MHLIDQQLNLMIRGRFDEARVVLREIEKEMLDNPRALFNRGWFLINEGKFQEGFQHLEHVRFLSVYGSPQLNTGKPIWHPQNTLEDKVVIINLEGGLGDEIMHARFAAEINNRGGKCILCADKTLGSLLSRVPGVEKVITKDDVQQVYHDYWIPGFSCSWIFGHDIDNFPNKPYIFPDKNKVNEWKDILSSDKKIKIGIR
jgi:hypothetical protein